MSSQSESARHEAECREWTQDGCDEDRSRFLPREWKVDAEEEVKIERIRQSLAKVRDQFKSEIEQGI